MEDRNNDAGTRIYRVLVRIEGLNEQVLYCGPCRASARAEYHGSKPYCRTELTGKQRLTVWQTIEDAGEHPSADSIVEEKIDTC